MRKFLILIAALLMFGSTQAQDETVVVTIDETPTESYWAGFSVGYPGLSVHAGLNDFLGNDVDGRLSLGYGYGGANGFAVEGDALFGLPIDVEGAPIALYAGVGPTIVIGDDFVLGINAFGGAEYRLSDLDFSAGGIFLEIGPSFVLTQNFYVDFIGRLGFNYHF